jgi:hypothetical protein
MDLPHHPGTQHWDGKIPDQLQVREAVVLVAFTGDGAEAVAREEARQEEARQEEARQARHNTDCEIVVVHAGAEWLVVAVEAVPRGESR